LLARYHASAGTWIGLRVAPLLHSVALHHLRRDGSRFRGRHDRCPLIVPGR